MDILDFIQQGQVKQASQRPSDVSGWPHLTPTESDSLVMAILTTYAARGTVFNSPLLRPLLALLHGRSLLDRLGAGFRDTEAAGGTVDAQWTRGGLVYPVSLKTVTHRLLRQGRTSATLMMHNTHGNTNNGKHHQAPYGLLIAFGVNLKQCLGCDIAVIPESTVRRHSKYTSDQVHYTVERSHCVDYVSLNGAEMDNLWRSHFAENLTPFGDPDKDFSDAMDAHIIRGLTAFLDGCLAKAKSLKKEDIRVS